MKTELKECIPTLYKTNLTGLLRVLAFVVIALGYAGCQTSQSHERFFSMVLLPDTQNYTDCSFGGMPKYFYDQTEWIKKNKKRLHIVMAAHLGDIVQNPGEHYQWQIADRAFRTIDHDVPYILCAGNHDIADYQGKQADARQTLLNTYFPPSRFTGNPVYKHAFGKDPQAHFMESGKSDNYYLYFTGGDTHFLILSLEFKPRDEVLQWAGRILEEHPDHRCVVLTHGYLNTRGVPGMNPCGLPGNDPAEIWEKLIRLHPNLFLVVCGHAPGEAFSTNTGQAGNQVLQILTDYQNKYIGYGGYGYLRILMFYPDKKEIKNLTYSPSLSRYLTRPESEFTLKYE